MRVQLLEIHGDIARGAKTSGFSYEHMARSIARDSGPPTKERNIHSAARQKIDEILLETQEAAKENHPRIAGAKIRLDIESSESCYLAVPSNTSLQELVETSSTLGGLRYAWSWLKLLQLLGDRDTPVLPDRGCDLLFQEDWCARCPGVSGQLTTTNTD